MLVAELEHLEAVMARDSVVAEAAHEGRVDGCVVEAVELAALGVPLVEWLLPLALEVDGVGEYQDGEVGQRALAEDGGDEIVRRRRDPCVDLLPCRLRVTYGRSMITFWRKLTARVTALYDSAAT